METGIELIKKERAEQITKHRWNDARNTNGELIEAAKFAEIATGRGIGFSGEKGAMWPSYWDDKYRRKILNKSKIEALSVAGAFYMAENDRTGSKMYDADVERIAAEIDEIINYNDVNLTTTYNVDFCHRCDPERSGRTPAPDNWNGVVVCKCGNSYNYPSTR